MLIDARRAVEVLLGAVLMADLQQRRHLIEPWSLGVVLNTQRLTGECRYQSSRSLCTVRVEGTIRQPPSACAGSADAGAAVTVPTLPLQLSLSLQLSLPLQLTLSLLPPLPLLPTSPLPLSPSLQPLFLRSLRCRFLLLLLPILLRCRMMLGAPPFRGAGGVHVGRVAGSPPPASAYSPPSAAPPPAAAAAAAAAGAAGAAAPVIGCEAPLVIARTELQRSRTVPAVGGRSH